MRKLPVPDVVEIHGADAWRELVTHFGVEEVETAPLSLDELPAAPTLVPMDDEAARWSRVLGDLWGATNAR